MKIVECKKQVNDLCDIILNEKEELYYLGERNGVIYIMEDEKDYRENTHYNNVGVVDITGIGYSNIKEFLNELFDCYNLTEN
nr:MAG TPA: hypothetical protein [Caudoviricetes sp.]